MTTTNIPLRTDGLNYNMQNQIIDITTNPLFSIIIPAYNAEKYLVACLDSIICQSFTNYEVIIIDDESNDRTPEICKDYSEKYKNIKYFFQRNQGPGAARNKGIVHASGEYLIFMDADDFLEDNSLEKIAKTTSTHPSVDIILGRVYAFDNNSGKKTFFTPEYDKKKIEHKSPIEVLLYLSAPPIESFWSVWNHVYNRKFIIDNRLMFKESVYAEDLEWMPHVIMKAIFFSFMQIPFYCHRIALNESLSFSNKMVIDIILVSSDWVSGTDSFDISSKDKDTLKRRFKNIFFSNLWRIWTCPLPQRKEILKEISSRKYMFHGSQTLKNRLIVLCCKCFGTSTTALLLNIRHHVLSYFS